MKNLLRGVPGANRILALSLAGFCLFGEANAQVVSPIERTGSQVIRDTVPKDSSDELAPLEASARRPDARLDVNDALDAATVKVSELHFAGSDLFDNAAMKSFIASEDVIGRRFSLAEIDALAARAQAFIRSQGFVFSRVSGPRQISDAASGVVTLVVVDARINEVSVEESAAPVGPVLAHLRSVAGTLAGKQNPNIVDLERALLLMRDVPGVTRATAIPRRSTSGVPGELDLVINVERKPVSGAIFADNRQAPSVGSGLIGLTGRVGSFGNGGDSVEITIINSVGMSFDDLDERHLAQISYDRRLFANGLTMHADAVLSLSEPGANLEALDLESVQYEFEVGLEYPIVRTRALSAWVSGSLHWLESKTETAGNTISLDSTRIVEVSGRGFIRDSYGYTAGKLSLRQGLSIFGASEKGDNNLSRQNGDPQALTLYAEVEREQQIFGDFTGFVRAAGQIASEPLLASEEFAIGTSTFGRGYDPSEFLGDGGFGLTGELRYLYRVKQDDAFAGLFNLQSVRFHVFGDYGRVFNRASGPPEDENVLSFGGGVRVNFDNRASIDFEFAKPMSDLQRTTNDDFQVFAGAEVRF